MALVAFQALPLPKEIVQFLAPNNAQAWVRLDSLGIAGPQFVTLSLNPHATLFEGLKWFCYAVAAWLAFSLAGSEAGMKNNDFIMSVAYTVTFTGGLISLIAIIQLGLGLNLIYGFFDPYHSSHFFGPYVNRNHFAGYLEMAMPLGIGLLGWLLTPGSFDYGDRSISSSIMKAELPISVSLCLVLMLTSLLLSLSRAGVVIGLVLIAGQIVLTVFLVSKRIFREKLFIAGFLFMAAIMSVGIFSDWHKLEQRFSSFPMDSLNTDIRFIVYKDTLRMSHDHLLFGVGLGGYQYSFPQYNTVELQGVFKHAHNDYLEILSELGWAGLIIFFLFMGFIINIIYTIFPPNKRFLKNNRQLSNRCRLLPIGLAFSMVAILLHSFFDFNIQIPANALLLFVIIGLILPTNSGKV